MTRNLKGSMHEYYYTNAYKIIIFLKKLMIRETEFYYLTGRIGTYLKLF